MTRLSTTENNSIQYATTGDENLNLFSRIGGMRNSSYNQIMTKFESAFRENPELATRISFWVRAARKGSGERKTFHIILKEIATQSPQFVSDNASLIAELGYWKDLLPYFYIDGVVNTFTIAIKSKDRLACKWAPRKGKNAHKLRDSLGFTNKEYRVWIKENSQTVEQDMSNKLWDNISYSSVPGSAMRRYGKSFDKRDRKRFTEWKEDKTSTASVSASYPHEIVKMGMDMSDGWDVESRHDADWDLIQKLWDNLPDFIKPGENILPMIDVSGSMCGLPMEVAISLGLYLSERNKGSFKDTFLTFNDVPELIKLSNLHLQDKLTKISNSSWGMNTNFEKSYNLILDTATSFNVSQEDMPTMLLVLSDMQFDASQNGRNRPHLELIRKRFERAGYTMPKLVFWNLRDSIYNGSPAQSGDDGVAMVSGFSPVLMKAILECDDFNPMDMMMESLKEIQVDCTNLPNSLDIIYESEDDMWDDDLPF
jgi:hypothetical protein